MKRACVLLVALLIAAAPAPAALAQGDPFAPLPPAPPAATPEPPEEEEDDDSFGAQDDVSRTTLGIILGAVVALFVGIGYFITRDARRALPEDARRDDPRLREEGPHRRPKQAKAKARAKTKAQKQARRAARRR